MQLNYWLLRVLIHRSWDSGTWSFWDNLGYMYEIPTETLIVLVLCLHSCQFFLCFFLCFFFITFPFLVHITCVLLYLTCIAPKESMHGRWGAFSIHLCNTGLVFAPILLAVRNNVTYSSKALCPHPHVFRWSESFSVCAGSLSPIGSLCYK